MKRRITTVLCALGFTGAFATTHTVLNTGDAGTGSLRDVVAGAAIGDTVLFDSGLWGDTIVLTSGQIELDRDIVIWGSASGTITISGNDNSRIFYPKDTVTTELAYLRLTNGDATAGGAIYNKGDLTLKHCHVTNNTARPTSHNSHGGGAIFNHASGELFLYDCTIDYNVARTTSTAAHGGAIFNHGKIYAHRTLFAHNELKDASVCRGGAFWHYSGGELYMYNCTISNNKANAGSGFGGAISCSNNKLVLEHCTVVENESTYRGGALLIGDETSIRNTIIAKNNCTGDGSNDIYSSPSYKFKSYGSNIFGNTTDANRITLGTGDQLNVDPLILPLGFYGGSTHTHALQCNSPAIDAGDSTNIDSLDQRGFVRMYGTTADIGAFEHQVPTLSFPATITECLRTGELYEFMVGAESDSVNWYDGEGNLLAANNNSLSLSSGYNGELTVQAYDYEGCSHANLTITVNLKEAPTVQFSADTVCLGDSTTFTDASIPTTDPAYNWDFDNNGIKDDTTMGNTSYTYTTPGVYSAKLTIVNHGGMKKSCTTVDSIQVLVRALPTVSVLDFNPDTVCLNHGILHLPMGTPSGGTYAGNGVVYPNFDPAAAGVGTHEVVYTFEDAHECSAMDTIQLTINGVPTVSLPDFNPDTVCHNGGLVSLPIGIPAGGTYSGVGVVNPDFDPDIAGAGTHTVLYTFTDSLNCSASDSSSIVVEICLGLEEEIGGLIQVFPNPTAGTLNLTRQHASPLQLELYNMTGKQVMQQQVNSDQTTIELHGLPAGVYFLQVAGNSTRQVIRVVKE